jgi:hypothetical protein
LRAFYSAISFTEIFVAIREIFPGFFRAIQADRSANYQWGHKSASNKRRETPQQIGLNACADLMAWRCKSHHAEDAAACNWMNARSRCDDIFEVGIS